MQLFEYPLWLVQQALSTLSYFWPITLVLVVPFVITLALKSPFFGSKARFCPRHLAVFLPMAVTVLILVWGTVMKHPTDSQSFGPGWPSHIILGLFTIQIIVSIGVVRFMKGYRLFSTFTVLLELWFALACAFIADMSVTGNWL